jgi:hypothetical protein
LADKATVRVSAKRSLAWLAPDPLVKPIETISSMCSTLVP